MSWYPATVTVAPMSEPLSLEQARRQCRIVAVDTSFDAELDDYIKSARSHVEQYCGTPFAARTIVAKADGFADLARLPLAPVISVTSIGYVDLSGAAQTLDADVYEVRLDGLEPSIALRHGQRWPSVQPGSRITLTAEVGYDVVPEEIVQAMALLVADFFADREVKRVDDWSSLDALLCNHRRGA